MNIKDFYNVIRDYAISVGFKDDENGIWRNNVNQVTGNDFENEAYFGFIKEGQGPSGPYADFSLCFMPQKDEDDDVNACAVCLIIGSELFRYDGELAQLPFTRRRFLKLKKDSPIYYKCDFSDYQNSIPELAQVFKGKYSHIRQFTGKYASLLVAFEIFDVEEFDLNSVPFVIAKWVCAYSEFRNWPSNASQRERVAEVLNKLSLHSNTVSLSEDDIYKILKKDRFVILQGAPGTGKTWTALNIANKYFDVDHVHFTQFHAETTYSDFVYGIKPDTQAGTLLYKDNPGILYEAMTKAKDGKDVLLIIDEINRANLSNVLGPVFYLFEKNTGDNRNYSIEIGGEPFKELPKNLYVIGTMNTADRSLAVVDFALRRRFTWITLKPKMIQDDPRFMKDYFLKFEDIFTRHADDNELNLQPGQAYFIADSEEEMKLKLKYELMPLMKEYINEGFLKSAKDELVNYFFNEIHELMYE